MESVFFSHGGSNRVVGKTMLLFALTVVEQKDVA
jgi:hypothetical protein